MKLGRNDPCSCGSGKKYKHCCLNAVSVQAAAPADLTWRRLRSLLDGYATEMLRFIAEAVSYTHLKNAMIRVRAGISYALTEAMDDGHCGLPTEELVPLAVELLEMSKELVQTALDLELSEGTVIAATVGETACVFLGGLYRAEQVIAERIVRIASGKLPWSYIDPEKALPWVERKTGLSLAESQVAAIRLALISKVLVITGGPGVGKTTIVNTILRILAANGVNLLLCAPTGRAAKRMTEATGFEAKTIHRLLEVDPKAGGFKRNSENPLECDLLIVDETSMVDVMLMQALMKAAPDNAALLIVGDIDQLPSVGPGQILADVIASCLLYTSRCV